MMRVVNCNSRPVNSNVKLHQVVMTLTPLHYYAMKGEQSAESIIVQNNIEL
jgi:hypothetical protein